MICINLWRKIIAKRRLKNVVVSYEFTWLHLSAIRPGQWATFYLPTHLPGRWPRPCAVVGSGVLVEQPSWNVGQRLQLLPPPALCSLTAWLRCRMSVGQRPWEHMPNSPVSRSNIINGSGRWYSFGASDSSTQNSVQCGWFLFTYWFKFLTHWSAITAFYMLSVLHETKCRRISFIKVMINSSTRNTVQCGWFYSRIWLKVSNSLVCNHSILHARGLHETKCWGIFFVSGLISLFSTETQLQRKHSWKIETICNKVSNSLVCNHSILHARGLHETKCWGIFFVSGLISLFSTENTTSKKIFMENWNNLQHVHINRIYKAIDSRSGL